MKKFSAVIAIAMVLCLLSACNRKTYEDGYADGYADAESEMQYYLEEEFIEGYDMGYEDCEYELGNKYDTGYEDGHSDGYYEGATYACLFFGDVDCAFQSANNGAAWYTFVDAYDQYISNIFDDEDRRLDLVWSLISATVGDGVTEEEKELLISTFGEGLFIRNGVNF